MLITPRIYPDSVNVASVSGRLVEFTVTDGGTTLVPELVETLRLAEADRERAVRVAQAAKEVVEDLTRIALDKQVVRCVWENPGSSLRLPRGPVRSIDALSVVVEGATSVLSTSSYYTSPGNRRVRLFAKGGGTLYSGTSGAPVFLSGTFTVGLAQGDADSRLLEAISQITSTYLEQVGEHAFEIDVVVLRDHVERLLRDRRIIAA